VINSAMRQIQVVALIGTGELREREHAL
jgi:hypothetical protein